jgi:hypothetical protein
MKHRQVVLLPCTCASNPETHNAIMKVMQNDWTKFFCYEILIIVNSALGTTTGSDEYSRVTNRTHTGTYTYVFQKCSVSTTQDCVVREFVASATCHRKPGVMDKLVIAPHNCLTNEGFILLIKYFIDFHIEEIWALCLIVPVDLGYIHVLQYCTVESWFHFWPVVQKL